MNTTTAKLALSPQRTGLIVWTLLALMPIVGMAIDLVAPSLPHIAKSLNISAEIAKTVIPIYLVGYALGNFITGFLTDAWGRRNLLNFSLLAFIIISLLPVAIPDITVLLVARFLQGIAIGAMAVLTRAVFADVLPPEKLVHLGTLIGTMWGLGPILGPMIGGYLQFYFGWKAGFCFFAFLGLAGLIATYFIVPETATEYQPLNFTTIKNNFLATVRHRLFFALVVLMGLVYSLVIAFQTIGPFLIQTQLHHSPVFFGNLALGMGIMFLTATFSCRYLLKKVSVRKLFLYGLNIAFIIALLAILISDWFNESVIFIILITALMYFECGFIFPMSMGRGLALFRHIAGTAAATMYLINILLASVTAFLVSFLSIHSVFTLTLTYFILMLLSLLVYWLMMNQTKL